MKRGLGGETEQRNWCSCRFLIRLAEGVRAFEASGERGKGKRGGVIEVGNGSEDEARRTKKRHVLVNVSLDERQRSFEKKERSLDEQPSLKVEPRVKQRESDCWSAKKEQKRSARKGEEGVVGAKREREREIVVVKILEMTGGRQLNTSANCRRIVKKDLNCTGRTNGTREEV